MGESEEAREGRMTYRIEFVASAQREFVKLPATERRRIAAKVDRLMAEPRPAGCVKLSGHRDIWRIRIGNYRVIYNIDDSRALLVVLKVSHRRESYREF